MITSFRKWEHFFLDSRHKKQEIFVHQATKVVKKGNLNIAEQRTGMAVSSVYY